MGYRVAVVGATGNVGREMLSILAERSFPADEVIALASRRSQGSEVSFGGDFRGGTVSFSGTEFAGGQDHDRAPKPAAGSTSDDWFH